MEKSYPSSAGSFKQEVSELLTGILTFHAETRTPFLLNAYPFFAYASDTKIPLALAIFEPNPGYNDPGSNLHYDNLFYEQIDAVYAAMKLLGFSDIPIRVAETGWSSAGDADQSGATIQNARLYNGNLISMVSKNQGTSTRPNVPLDVYIFTIFNENLKEGKLSEKNFGLYYPNDVPVYNCGLHPRNDKDMSSSSSSTNEMSSSSSSSSTNAVVVSLLALFFVPLVSFVF